MPVVRCIVEVGVRVVVVSVRGVTVDELISVVRDDVWMGNVLMEVVVPGFKDFWYNMFVLINSMSIWVIDLLISSSSTTTSPTEFDAFESVQMK